MISLRLYVGCVALCLCASDVKAYISYYNPGEPIQVPVTGPNIGLLLDLDFNGTDDILLTSTFSEFRAHPQGNNEIIADEPLVLPLSYGTPINDSPSAPGDWTTNSSIFANCQNSDGEVVCIGLWLTEETSDAYFGLRFDIEGETHYGWVHLVNTFGITGYITEWAYETTPDTGILAGVVPEPATSLLVVAGLLILHFKNKKRRFR